VQGNGEPYASDSGTAYSNGELNDLLELIRSSEAASGGGSIELLLRQMNPQTASVVRLCAIPHRFNPRLIRVLAPDISPRRAEDEYRRILSLSMITTSGESAQMHDLMRGHLFHQWLEPANEQEFRRASAALYDYFRTLSGNSQGPDKTEPYRYRAMFHLIGANQTAGFKEFDALYRERHHQFRLAECERLVRLVGEYKPALTPDHAIQLLYCEAQVAADYRRWEEARGHLTRVLASPDAGNDLKARAENRLGIIDAAERNYDSAIAHYDTALNLAQMGGSEYPYAYRIKHDLGAAYRDKGDSDKAQDLLKESIQLALAAEDYAYVATSYNSLGLLHGRRHEMAEAVEALTLSIAALQKIGDTVREATVYNNLGNIHYDVGRWTETEHFYDRSLEITKQTSDSYGQAVALTNLGSVYQRAKKYPQAMEALEEATRIFEWIGDSYKSGLVRRKLARLYWRLGRQAEARDSFEKAIAHFEKRGGKTEAAETRTELDRLGKKVGLPWWAWVGIAIALVFVLLIIGVFAEDL